MSRPARFALIANPRSPRALGFVDACRAGGFGETTVIPWVEWLGGGMDSARIPDDVGFLRIETPAEHDATERLILARGAAACEKEGRHPLLSPPDCQHLHPDEGVTRYQRQWYLGWEDVLQTTARSCASLPIRLMNDPREISTIFDKEATRAVLARNELPIPPGAGICADFDELVAKMDQTAWNRVFLKPCHGSSAGGVMAIARNPRGMWHAYTSAAVHSSDDYPRIRNSKQVLHLGDLDTIRETVNAVCLERALVERWFPKASIAGRPFDLRVLVLDGRAAHVAVRTSQSPITNLHLRNRRADLDEVKQALGAARWIEAMEVAEAAARAFPGCHYCGVDLMIGAGGRGHAIAEINAFGDYLRHELWEGMNPWQAELRSWSAVEASPPRI